MCMGAWLGPGVWWQRVNHGRIPDRLNLGLICILEAKGENKVRLSVACS